ncbi:hypothetical protein VTO42DRAFT_6228 [Malbranchea cinnamomea]
MSTTMASGQSAGSSTYSQYDQIILFGDSITQGSGSQEKGFAFAPALQHDYIRRFDVINRGFSGYNSSQGIVILPQIFPPPEIAKVRLMTIFFGANDAVLSGGRQHVPLEKYTSCLEQIITHPTVRAQGTKLLLLTPPPVNQHQLEPSDWVKVDNTRRTAENTKKYADACREVGNRLGVPVVDIWSAFMKAAGWKEGEPLAGSIDVPENEKLRALLSDGLHFNPSGYRIMYDEVRKAIETHYPELMPERIPMNFPSWETAPGQDDS